MKVFWVAMVFGLCISSAHAFTVYEITEPEGYAPFAENENILTWGDNNFLGEGATVSYSIATSNYSCFGGYESCVPLESFMPQGYENTIALAFDRWASVANLSFNQVDDLSGDIVWAGELLFGWVGVELAHAGTAKNTIEIEGETFSQIAWSEIHFNEIVSWSIEGSPLIGYDFLTIATHEIGHALGLGHSEVVGALMYADYQGINTLQADDIAGIQYLYGAVSAVPEPATYLQFLLGLLVLLGLTRRTKLQAYKGG